MITNIETVTKNNVLLALDDLIDLTTISKKLFHELDVQLIPQCAFNELVEKSKYMNNKHSEIESIWIFICSLIREYTAYKPVYEGGSDLNYNMYMKANGESVHLSGVFRETKLNYLIGTLKKYEYAEGIKLL